MTVAMTAGMALGMPPRLIIVAIAIWRPHSRPTAIGNAIPSRTGR